MRKLFKTTVSVDVIVAAENESEATTAAKVHAGKEMADYGQVSAVAPITSLSELPDGWQKYSPYSVNPEETRDCQTILVETMSQGKPAKNSPLKPKKQKKAEKAVKHVEETTATTTGRPSAPIPKHAMPPVRFK